MPYKTADDALNDGLTPLSGKQSISSRLVSSIMMCVKIVFGLVMAPICIVLLLVATLSGIGPLINYLLTRRDKESLDRDTILQQHPEMFLIDIPAGINHASGDKSYRAMVRVTKPTEPPADKLPPVIVPGGLASNLMTMSRHQDELTSKYGFTVVNFDRLGVGLSDAYPSSTSQSPSAADVAREMNYVMTHCVGIDDTEKWIQVGGSMGTNVATAFVALFPNRLCGFFNLDGLPHAFLQIQCKKFLKDGKQIMDVMNMIQWTGIPRLAFTAAIQPMLPVMGDAFTKQQMIGVMCREQFFTTTGLEYTTLMSCCDLECAAWGKQATTEYDGDTLRVLASIAPDESVIVNESKGVPRKVTTERSKSELGTCFLTHDDPECVKVERTFRTLALQDPTDIDRNKTHCNWPQPSPKHPVGEFVGGVDEDTTIYPLAPQFKAMVVRIMCARDYTGLEQNYSQEARNHAAARCSLQSLMSDDAKVYYYPQLSHLNLWQQVSEVTSVTNEIAQAVMRRK